MAKAIWVRARWRRFWATRVAARLFWLERRIVGDRWAVAMMRPVCWAFGVTRFSGIEVSLDEGRTWRFSDPFRYTWEPGGANDAN